MTDWILILTYLVTPLLSDPVECTPMPDGFDKDICIVGAQPELPSESVGKTIVLNVYRGDTAKKDCVDQAVRYADNVDFLPLDIGLQIAEGTPMTYTCRGVPQ